MAHGERRRCFSLAGAGEHLILIRHQQLNRILVIGSGGSGKTTVARRLAERTGLPLIHLDALYWRPGWDATAAEEWRNIVRQLIARDAWIIDGNYGGTLDIRFEACDTIVFLDISRIRCIWGVLRRHIRHMGKPRPDMASGCPERFSWEFLRWIWTYPAQRRPAILSHLEELRGRKRVVILRSQREVEQFLAAHILERGGRP